MNICTSKYVYFEIYGKRATLVVVTFHKGTCFILWFILSSKSKLAKVNKDQGYSCHSIKS